MDAAIRQVDTFRTALRVLARVAARNGVQPKEVFVYPEFALDVANSLVDMMTDVSALHPHAVNGDVLDTSLEKRITNTHEESIKRALDDTLRILAKGDDSNIEQPIIMSDRLVHQLLCDVVDVAENIVSAIKVMEEPFDVRVLKMTDPHFPLRVLTWLQSTVGYCISRDEASQSPKKACGEHDTNDTDADKVRACDRLDDIHRQMKQIQGDEERNTASLKAQLDRLTTEYATQRELDHGKLRDQDAEIARLKDVETTLTSTLQQVRDELAQARAELVQEKAGRQATEEERDRYLARLQDTERTVQEQVTQLAEQESEIDKLRQTRPVTLRLLGSSSVATPSSKRKAENMQDTNPTTDGSQASPHENAVTLPPARTAELMQLPVISVDLSASHGKPASFREAFIRETLGGKAHKPWNLRIRKADKPLATRHSVEAYLFVGPEHSAWIPSGPGKHGFIHIEPTLASKDRRLSEISLGSSALEQGSSRSLRMCHIFLGRGLGKHDEYQYAGYYCLTLSSELTKEEWESLPDRVKNTCVQSVLNRPKLQQNSAVKLTDEVVRRGFFSGERSAVCVLLECVAFDAAFYQALVQENAGGEQESPSKRPRLSLGHEESVQ